MIPLSTLLLRLAQQEQRRKTPCQSPAGPANGGARVLSVIQEPLVVSGGGMSADKNGPTAATKNGLQHREADVDDVHC